MAVDHVHFKIAERASFKFSSYKITAPQLGNTYANELNLIIAQCVHISKRHIVPTNICTHSLSIKKKTKTDH